MRMKLYKTVAAYIGSYPKDTQAVLKKLRLTIRKAAPKAEESISYGMPVYRQNGNLVYIGGFKKHVSFFPGRAGIEAFLKEAKPYKAGTGTMKFLLDAPIPYALVARITKFRVKENLRK
jgi:uncharacterized protein YdhG (YjbR/CyaY superfamily)